MLIREYAVAGSFYPLDKDNLKKKIEELIYKHPLGPKNLSRDNFRVCIVPHAGYDYSGAIASHIYSKIENSNYIIVGPNHYGRGAKFSIFKKGLWKTPLGEIAIDEEAAENLMSYSKILEFDVVAHENEHSIEVQIPFLQFRFGNEFKIVPISILNEFADDILLNECKEVGDAIYKLMKENENYKLIASSDLSHYLPYDECVKKDNIAIEQIKKMREKSFFKVIKEENINACGFAAIAIAIIVAKKLKYKKAVLLKYANSGDVTGDKSLNVGYPAIIFK